MSILKEITLTYSYTQKYYFITQDLIPKTSAKIRALIEFLNLYKIILKILWNKGEKTVFFFVNVI